MRSTGPGASLTSELYDYYGKVVVAQVLDSSFEHLILVSRVRACSSMLIGFFLAVLLFAFLMKKLMPMAYACTNNHYHNTQILRSRCYLRCQAFTSYLLAGRTGLPLLELPTFSKPNFFNISQPS